ncbi:MAG: DUF3619 family protein [Deltaproteobacteria bacterium]|nr:DUF3619 family protein [Deltaproteobacteria bacterium]
MNDKDDLIKHITKHLDHGLEHIDPEILSRIRTARYKALERKQPVFLKWALPIGGIAVAALVLTVSINLFTGSEKSITRQTVRVVETEAYKPESEEENILLEKDTGPEITPDQIELVEILSSEQQMDLFENLEFYAWLAENEDITG